MSTYALIGFGVTNRCVANSLVRRGHEVAVFEDHPSSVHHGAADQLGISLQRTDAVEQVLATVDAVVPSPGLAESHPVFESAKRAGVPIQSEFDLAREWDQRPLVSITGTNGKTTVTTLVSDMLNNSGIAAAAVGNTDVPLVQAIDEPSTRVFVVESSSFRLAHTQLFLPEVAAWLNFAPDHLDVHRDLRSYELAKARTWRDLGPQQVALGCRDDAVVLKHHATAPGRRVTFGSGAPAEGDYGVADGWIVGPLGRIVSVASLRRSLPHDVTNAAAAAACALHMGATLESVGSTLQEFAGLAHRVQFVRSVSGVDYFDDSKATAPHAVVAALNGFESVVLIAGGRNKGLDLSELSVLGPRLRAAVGIGEAAHDIVSAFPGCETAIAATMDQAVQLASAFAEPGDSVVLSPGCASFDWYSSYSERGDDFVRAVEALGAQHVDA